jgi:hypothetical protein
VKTNPSHELTSRFFFDCPNSKTTEMPVPNHCAHVAPRLETIPYLPAEKPHYFGIRTERSVSLEIFQTDHSHE